MSSATIRDVNTYIPVEGRISWYEETDSGLKLLYKNNKILTSARTIMRDLVYGDFNTITKCQLGSYGLTMDSNLNFDPPEPDDSDTSLMYKVTEVPVSSKTKQDNNGRPSVTFTFKLPAGDNMGTPTGEFVICEIALVREDAAGTPTLFAMARHKPMTKQPFAGYILQWEILF